VTDLNENNLKISSVNEKLVKWILEETSKRGWSYREVGRRGDFSHTLISDVINGQREPTYNFCASLAKAFSSDGPEIRPEDVFRIAGLLPPSAGEMSDLSEEEMRVVRLWRKIKWERDRRLAIIMLEGMTGTNSE
jgi:transcriptional regulator with XRE-family HTH domain